MVDNLSPEKRSRVMSAIRSKDTGPELAVRRLVWSMGVRYRIHDRSVFGTPDLPSFRDLRLGISAPIRLSSSIRDVMSATTGSFVPGSKSFTRMRPRCVMLRG